MAFKFLHAADLHLDSPFLSLGQMEPWLTERLSEASLAVLDRVVEIAIDEGVSLVLFAGDQYDGAKRGIRAQLRFQKALRRLDEAGIDVLMIHGNHDPVGEGWRAIPEFPSNTHVFSHERPETREFERGGVRVTVTGMSYPSRHVREDLSQRFERPPGPGFHVGLLHTALDDSERGANYSPTFSARLRDSGFHYWALGHYHKRAEYLTSPWIVYPGTTQGRGFGVGEVGEKGVYVVTVEGESATLSFRATSSVVFEKLEVDVGGCTDLEQVESRVRMACEGLQYSEQVRVVAAQLVLTGRSAVYGHMQRPEAVDDWTDVLRELTVRGVDWVWLGWTDAVLPEINFESLRTSNSFAGTLVQQAESYGLQEVHKLVNPYLRKDHLLTDEQACEVLERAMFRATDLISQ